jgi:D-aminopeptidase
MRHSALCPVEKTQRSGPIFGNEPPEGHHHLRNPIPTNMDQRHCIVSGHVRTEMSCSVAEKSLTALSMLSRATKTQSSGQGFGDELPKGHHHLRNPIPPNMDQRHCIVSGHVRTDMSCSVAEKSLTALSMFS